MSSGQRKCKKGYPCGRTCISRNRNCRNRLSGQGRNYADFLKNNPEGISGYILKGRRLLSSEDADYIDRFPSVNKRVVEGLNKKEAAALDQVKRHPDYSRLAQAVDDRSKRATGASIRDRYIASRELQQARDALENFTNRMTGEILKKDPEYLQLQQEDRAINERIGKILDSIRSSSTMTRQEAEALISRRVGLKPLARSTVREHVIDFAIMTGGRGLDESLFIEERYERAGTNRFTRAVVVPPRDRLAVFHEIAHHIEYQEPAMYEIANQWRRGRATSQNPVLMKELTGDPKYGDDEVALPDQFYHPYVGRVYSAPATEVISMGIQGLSSASALRDLANDPEHLYLTLGILRR